MRFFKTIKFRITLWYLTLLMIAVLLFSCLSYLVLSHRVSMMNLDAVNLTVREVQVKSAVNIASPTEITPASSAYEFLTSYVIESEQLQEIKSRESSPFEIMSPEGIVTFDQKDFISPDMLGEQEVWLYSRPSASKPDYNELLVVTQSKTEALSMLSNYKQVLYVAIPVTLILVGLLGYFLIRRLLNPMGLITQTSREIQENDLEWRIEVKSNDELGELSSTLNQTFARLQKSFEREHRFTSDTSHELRAPLAIMQGEATLALNRSRSEEEYRQHLESISEQVTHMSSVVNKLLFLARSDKDKEILNLEDVNLKNILEDIVAATQVFREGKNLGLHLELRKDVIIKGDEVKLKELFLNLIDNAIKYTHPGGEINLSLDIQGDMTKIIIKDTGIGISAEHLPHLFERFYRINRKGSEEGNGLGLAICKRIVELHRGNIGVESSIGQGSAFIVVLPYR